MHKWINKNVTSIMLTNPKLWTSQTQLAHRFRPCAHKYQSARTILEVNRYF